MKNSIKFMLHFFLWILVFFTFIYIINAINGFPKKPEYNPHMDLALYFRSIIIAMALMIPFYFGYFFIPYFKKA